MLDFEFQILDLIQTHLSCEFLDTLIPLFTSLGNAGICWIIAALTMSCTKKYRVNGIVMLLALTVGLLIGNVTLKPLIARARPCWIRDVTLLIPNPTDYSFPSGHTLSSVIGATCLTYANRKFGMVAIPFAVIMAFTRLYLYVHFPSDILIGALLGVVVGGLMQKTIYPLQLLLNRAHKK